MSPDPRPLEPLGFAVGRDPPRPEAAAEAPAEPHLEHWSARLQAYVSMLNLLTPARREPPGLA